MPLYEYECSKCGERFEIIQRFSDEPFKTHSENDSSDCDGPVRKLLAAPAIQFKGSGWYVNDYGKGGKKPPAEASESGSKPEKEKKASSSSEGSGKDGKATAKGGGSDSSSKSAAVAS